MRRPYRLHLAFQGILLLSLLSQSPCAISLTPTAPTSPVSSIASKNFWQLNDALALYQNASKQAWEIIPEEPRLLKRGMHNSIVPIIRERLKMTGDLAPSNDKGGNKFDVVLSEAVASFQMQHGLKPDGTIGPDTRTELNIPPEERMKQIALNMQRWANLANKLGSRYIMVNIPDYHMYLVDNDQTVLMMKAIVGKRDLQTPEITSRVTRVVFNPYWNIPVAIAQRDIVPKMLDDSSYVQRLHIRAFRNEDGEDQIDTHDIDWQSAEINGLNYHLRQDPGPDNALGLVKFEFANSHDVYMHDTPAKNLFDTDVRDLSHGCIRLENPFALVEYLMKDDPKWDELRMQTILDSGKTIYMRVVNPIPIFVTYITAWVGDNGRINFRSDVYQQDQSL